MVTLVRDPAVFVSVFPRPAWPVPAAAVGLYLPMSDLRKEKGLDPRPPAEPEVPPGAPNMDPNMDPPGWGEAKEGIIWPGPALETPAGAGVVGIC